MSTEIIKEEKENKDEQNVSVNAPKVSSNPVDDVKQNLTDIDKKYEEQYPKPLDESQLPQFKEVETHSRDTLENLAQEELKDYEYESKTEIQNDYQEDMSELSVKQSQIELGLEKTKNELQNELILGLESNKAQQISQGIELSSIAENMQESLKASIDEELQYEVKKANIALAELELKRDITRNEMTSALDEFNIEYASKLEDKINELTKEYDDYVLELEKYNNKIAELRREHQQEWQEWADAKKSELDAKKGQEKAVYVIQKLRGLTKQEALRILNDADIKASLGAWYSTVLDYVNRMF
ncbi:MAG: hypothetical protein J6C13_02200 [Clostridia bacterium]|nr:hypothetical protein [Clostridia bacterium]